MLWSKTYSLASPDVDLDRLDISSDPANFITPQSSWRKRHLKGWRVGVLAGASLATIGLAINLAVTIVTSKTQSSDDFGRYLLFEGDCAQAERLNVVAHLLINLMSTILLSASNYGMQLLSAPTRNEVDIAHASKRWLDIGILSVRNLSSICWKRRVLWALLGLSSLPLHLLYNSAVFSTLTAYDYTVLSAMENMFTANSTPDAFVDIQEQGYKTVASTMFDQFKSGKLERLEPRKCIDAYATNIQTDRGNVILVTDDNNGVAGGMNYSDYVSAILPGFIHCPSNPFDWICGQEGSEDCTISKLVEPPCSVIYKSIDPDNWTPAINRVQYCLSEPVSGRCKVQFSATIAYVVIACNFGKAVILFTTFFFVTENPLITMGDAVASFLRSADKTTASLCLMSQDKLAMWEETPVPQPFTRGTSKASRRWSNTVSPGRWVLCTLLYATAILVCTVLFFYGTFNKFVSPSELMSLPIGSLNPATFIFGWGVPSTGNSGVISNVLVANSPQLILSIIYYTYNSLITCFFGGREWAQYAIQRKTLRVSAIPRGQQRSTYFLQLPYRIAFPLMILSGLLHWLTSQSIFLVNIQQVAQGSESTITAEFLTCGYSPPAILSVVIIAIFMSAVVMYLSRRRFRGFLPIVGTRSACISAMCHLPAVEQDKDSAYYPVQWGVSGENVDKVDNHATVAHCSFSSLPVRLPEESELCA